MRRESIIMLGEGLTEALFLNHLKQEFQVHLRMRVKVDKGQGKSPKDAANLLIRKHLRIANYDRSLLFIDSDVKNNIPENWLKDNNITLVRSTPMCLEGLMLRIMDELPKGGKNAPSKALKSHMIQVLKTDQQGYTQKLQKELPRILPRELLERKRSSSSELDELLNFLDVKG